MLGGDIKRERPMNRRIVPVVVAVIATALMAFSGTASADTVTSPTGTTYTGSLAAASEGHTVLHNPIAKIECAGTFAASVESHPAGGKVSGAVHPTFTGCTNSWHVTTENVGGAYGALTVDSTSGHNGTVTSMWSRIITTRFGITCVYETFLTHIGVTTGGNPATLHFDASIPIDEDDSSGLCGSGNAKWEGNYVTTSALYVANS